MLGEVIILHVIILQSPNLFLITIWISIMSGSKGLWVVFYFGFVFRDRISLCSPICPGTHSVDQSHLRLTEIQLPLLPTPQYWD